MIATNDVAAFFAHAGYELTGDWADRVTRIQIVKDWAAAGGAGVVVPARPIYVMDAIGRYVTEQVQSGGAFAVYARSGTREWRGLKRDPR